MIIYNGDGQQVKSWVLSGYLTTAYIGNHFEYTSTTDKRTYYYYTGCQRVAMRSGSTLYFLLGDHLGSTSIAATASGGSTAS